MKRLAGRVAVTMAVALMAGQAAAADLEQIYRDKNIKVKAVNTINVKAKARRVRGRSGFKAAFKKAVVTLDNGDSLDNI